MQWVIQTNDLPDGQTEKLQQALTKWGKTWIEIQVVPFTDHSEIIGLDKVDPELEAFFYGSVEMDRELYKSKRICPLYYEPEWFDPRNWLGKRTDLLNEDWITTTVKELRANWVEVPTFIKPVTDKAFNGMVIEPDKKDRDIWLIEQATVPPEEVVMMASYKKLEREFRFFILDGWLITGSQYRKDGYKAIMDPIDIHTWAIAQEMATRWMPSENIVMDIGQTREGDFKVIEWNCIHSSGFYNSRVEEIVLNLEENMWYDH